MTHGPSAAPSGAPKPEKDTAAPNLAAPQASLKRTFIPGKGAVPKTATTPVAPSATPATAPAASPTPVAPSATPATPPAASPTPAAPSATPATPPATSPTPAAPSATPATPPASKAVPALTSSSLPARRPATIIQPQNSPNGDAQKQNMSPEERQLIIKRLESVAKQQNLDPLLVLALSEKPGLAQVYLDSLEEIKELDIIKACNGDPRKEFSSTVKDEGLGAFLVNQLKSFCKRFGWVEDVPANHVQIRSRYNKSYEDTDPRFLATAGMWWVNWFGHDLEGGPMTLSKESLAIEVPDIFPEGMHGQFPIKIYVTYRMGTLKKQASGDKEFTVAAIDAKNKMFTSENFEEDLTEKVEEIAAKLFSEFSMDEIRKPTRTPKTAILFDELKRLVQIRIIKDVLEPLGCTAISIAINPQLTEETRQKFQEQDQALLDQKVKEEQRRAALIETEGAAERERVLAAAKADAERAQLVAKREELAAAGNNAGLIKDMHTADQFPKIPNLSVLNIGGGSGTAPIIAVQPPKTKTEGDAS